MTNEDRETLRAIAADLRSSAANAPNLASKLREHAEKLEALAVEQPSRPMVISNPPRYQHDGPFGGGRRR
jgi:hypothetical protein